MQYLSVDTITIGMYAQFVTLILPVALTSVRRKCPKLLTCLLLQLAVPACIHPLLYLFFYLTESFDLINNLTIHVVLILVMYIVMRQIAVFDEKYYHSIRRSSKPAALLKKDLPVGNSSTPGQIEAVLLKQGDKEISSLRKEYEKVRYGR